GAKHALKAIWTGAQSRQGSTFALERTSHSPFRVMYVTNSAHPEETVGGIQHGKRGRPGLVSFHDAQPEQVPALVEEGAGEGHEDRVLPEGVLDDDLLDPDLVSRRVGIGGGGLEQGVRRGLGDGAEQVGRAAFRVAEVTVVRLAPELDPGLAPAAGIRHFRLHELDDAWWALGHVFSPWRVLTWRSLR